MSEEIVPLLPQDEPMQTSAAALAEPSKLTNGDLAPADQDAADAANSDHQLHTAALNGVPAPDEQPPLPIQTSTSFPPPPPQEDSAIGTSQTSSGQLLANDITAQYPSHTQPQAPASQPPQAIPPSTAAVSSTSMAPPPAAASPARGSPAPKVEGSDPSLPPSVVIPPKLPHGSPTRQYVNNKVTPWLLEGMKWIALNEPEKPLKWLGEYFLQMSREVEGE